jgi:hypothetical protein
MRNCRRILFHAQMNDHSRLTSHILQAPFDLCDAEPQAIRLIQTHSNPQIMARLFIPLEAALLPNIGEPLKVATHSYRVQSPATPLMATHRPPLPFEPHAITNWPSFLLWT